MNMNAKVMNEHVKAGMSIYARLMNPEDENARGAWLRRTTAKTFVLAKLVPLAYRLKALS